MASEDDLTVPQPTARPPGTSPSASPLPRPPHRMPEQIGPYRIIERIGEGGMGEVYKAEQRSPVRRIVALKLIKVGMDTEQVIARFEAERQALAMLSHPNVARVFEAGMTDNGRPFFAMEYVAGVPLTTYCDQNRLTMRQRLELFIQVCHAVQHAHQKGIIHRDLKPTNILVAVDDAQPVPKVIDFGIAKATNQALTQHTLFTQTGTLIGTPEYMSPEQAMTSGLDVDTRTDIYSLGAILYELVTGTLPFDPDQLRSAGLEQMARIIRETDPLRPSTRLGGATVQRPGMDSRTLFREVCGDLDWIILKAMEKDRTRRYGTANDLAMDIQRHLANEPVLACPPTTAYRLRKFVRRYRGPVAAVSALTLALVLGIVGTTIGLLRARNAERDANNGRQTAEKATARALALQAAERDQRRLADQRAEALERQLYRFNLAQAKSALDTGELRNARDLLQACQPAARGWEWHFLNRLAGGLEPQLTGLNNQAEGLDISPDGHWIVASGWKGKVLLQTLNGTTCRPLPGGAGRIRRVHFSPDGTRIAGGCGNGHLLIWSVSDATLLHDFAVHTDAVEDCVWIGDGRRLAVCAGDILYVIDSESGKALARTPPGAAAGWSLAASPEGTRIYVGGDTGNIQCLQTDTCAPLWSRREDNSGICSVSLSADGDTLLAHAYNGRSRLLDATTGEVLETTRHPQLAAGAALDPDGQVAVSPLPGGSVHVWSAITGQTLRFPVQVSRASVSNLAFTPDGSALVALDNAGGLHVVDADFGKPPPPWAVPDGALGAFCISPDGKRFATASQGNPIRVYDARTWQLLCELPPGQRDVRMLALVSGTGPARLAAGCSSGEILLYDVGSARRERIISTGDALVSALAFSPDGRQLACAAAGAGGPVTQPASTRPATSAIEILNPDTGQQIASLPGHAGAVQALQFTADSRQLASGSRNHTIRLWNLATRQPVRTIDTGAPVSAVTLSPDARLLLAAESHPEQPPTCAAWNLDTSTLLYRIPVAPRAPGAAFLPDGSRFAVAGPRQTLQICQADTGVVLLTTTIDTRVSWLDFAADGHTLVWADNAGLVRFWESGPTDRDARLRRNLAVTTVALRTLGNDWWVNVDRANVEGPGAITPSEQADIDRALPMERRLVSLQRRLLGNDHIDLAASLTRLGRGFQARGRWEQAQRCFRQAIDIRRRFIKTTSAPPGSEPRFQLSHNLVDLGFSLLHLHRNQQAEQAFRECIALRSERPPHWSLYDATNALGAALAAEGRYQEAEPLLVDSYEKLAASSEVWPNRKREAIDRIIAFYTAWEKPEQAKQWQARKDREFPPDHQQ